MTIKRKKSRVLIEDDTWVMDERKTHEEDLLQHEKQQMLETQIKALPERQRVALNLCFYEELRQIRKRRILWGSG